MVACGSELRLFGRADYKVKTLHRLSPSSLSAARLGLSREKLRRTATAEKRSICPWGLSFMHGDIREPVAGEDQSMPETQESKHKFDPYFLYGPRISRPASCRFDSLELWIRDSCSLPRIYARSLEYKGLRLCPKTLVKLWWLLISLGVSLKWSFD